MKLNKPHTLLEPKNDIDELIPRISEELPPLSENEGDSAYMNWLNDIMRKTDMVQNNTELIESTRYELADS
jgi:hypothetical protein